MVCSNGFHGFFPWFSSQKPENKQKTRKTMNVFGGFTGVNSSGQVFDGSPGGLVACCHRSEQRIVCS